MFSTGTITRLADASVKSNRQWLPNQLYQGSVRNIRGDGSLDVMINGRLFQAQAFPQARQGDTLSLRLLGTLPEPHFAVVGVLRRAAQEEAKAQPKGDWLQAAGFLRKLNPGLAALNSLWQQDPEQLSRLSWQLPALLSALSAKALPAEDLLKPGRLKSRLLSGGAFYESSGESDPLDVKPLLFRLLAALGGTRQLTLQQGRPVFVEQHEAAAQSLQNRSIALYAQEQEAGSGGYSLRQLLSLNVETALQQLVTGQLSALHRSDGEKAFWIMQLMLNCEGELLPVEFEFGRRREEAGERWEVRFMLELPRAGRIAAELVVKKPTTLIRLECQNAGLVALLNQQQIGLKRLLEKQGLLLREFTCVRAEQP